MAASRFLMNGLKISKYEKRKLKTKCKQKDLEIKLSTLIVNHVNNQICIKYIPIRQWFTQDKLEIITLLIKIAKGTRSKSQHLTVSEILLNRLRKKITIPVTLYYKSLNSPKEISHTDNQNKMRNDQQKKINLSKNIRHAKLSIFILQ